MIEINLPAASKLARREFTFPSSLCFTHLDSRDLFAVLKNYKYRQKQKIYRTAEGVNEKGCPFSDLVFFGSTPPPPFTVVVAYYLDALTLSSLSD